MEDSDDVDNVIDTISKIMQSSADIDLFSSVTTTESPYEAVVIENLVVDEPSQKITVAEILPAESSAIFESKITTDSQVSTTKQSFTEPVTENQFTDFELDQNSESPEENEISSDNNDIDSEFISLDTEPLMEEDSLNRFGENEQEMAVTTTEPELTEQPEMHSVITTEQAEELELTSNLPIESNATFKDDHLTENEIKDFGATTPTSDIVKDIEKLNDVLTTIEPISTTVSSMIEIIRTTEYSTQLPTTVTTPKFISSSTTQAPTTVKGILAAALFNEQSVNNFFLAATKGYRTGIELEKNVVSLGLACSNDQQCQLSDPHTFCNKDKLCDCSYVGQPNQERECHAKSAGCPPGTFQCRSTGVCISWFFVCDNR